MIERYQGKVGEKILREALAEQQLINGNVFVVDFLISHGALIEVPPNETLITQDAEDTDIYFILAGSIEVLINKRSVANRVSGQHIGEMALINPTGTRSASIVSKEKSVLYKVSEEHFAEIAESNPILWRRLAAELVKRLRERSKYIVEPNDLPKVFIGSSSECFKKAEDLKNLLEGPELHVAHWKDGIFKASTSTLTSLLETASSYDFAILILHPDDMTESRGNESASPRDNVIFELGLFLGSLKSERVFILRPDHKDLKIPSDLLGITCLSYQLNETPDSDLEKSSKYIKNEIENLKVK